MRTDRISIVLLLSQVPIIASHYFGQVTMPYNMLRTLHLKTDLKSKIECGTWCSKNVDHFTDCTAFYFEDGPDPSCECGEANCHDANKGYDSQEIMAYVNTNCRRILPPG